MFFNIATLEICNKTQAKAHKLQIKWGEKVPGFCAVFHVCLFLKNPYPTEESLFIMF